ncbi:MAG: transposase, partial [Victivallaceae bacterium]
GVKFLFKLKQSVNVKKLLEQLEKGSHDLWQDAGDGWHGYETSLQLMGWSRSRRVIVLRRPASQKTKQESGNNLLSEKTAVQGELLFPEVIAPEQMPEYDWAALVTNLDSPMIAVAQLYRDRGDCENIFDELKNQWGWGGFTTQDIKRSSIMARMVALVYNWWNIFCRLAEPERHMEAKTSRPLLQQVIGRLSNRGGKRLLHLTAVGAYATDARRIFEQVSSFLKQVISTAPQLNQVYKWTLILAQAFKAFFRNRNIFPGSEGNQILLPIS